MRRLVSIIIPAYNESVGISHFHKELCAALPTGYDFEVIFVNDGSTDSTLEKLYSLQSTDPRVRIISLSRNFGKEVATTAGIIEAHGEAIVIIDADGQHPVELISQFLDEWTKGRKVVIGVRKVNQNEGAVKHYGSKLFYRLFNLISGDPLVPGSTDFRLIDREVQQEFSRLKEHSRITRALIDWLGYEKSYITFVANPRVHGEATYSTSKLLRLAINSVVSLTTFPLYASAYLGIIITLLSLLIGLFIFVEQYILGDPMSLNITGSASLGFLILFLVGIMLACQGLVAMYISRIYEEVKGRPLYIIDKDSSRL